MRRSILLSLLLAGLTAGAALAQPNIVFIMLDDVGFGDVGAYGGAIPTPEIDALAAAGLRFDSYYTNGAVCSPTRASIISGQYPLKFGFVSGVGMGSARGIPQSEPALPRILKEAGYATWHFGKWHLGLGPGYTACDKGYDSSIRFTRERDSDSGLRYINPELETACDPASKMRVQGRHATEVLTTRAIEQIQAHLGAPAPQSEPFFLSLWYFAPHSPYELPPLLPPGAVPFPERYLPPHCEAPFTAEEQFGALLCFADFQIGRLVQAIDAAGIAGETLIVVASDNGGVEKWKEEVVHTSNGPLAGFKSETLEGGIRVPMVARWPGTTPVGVDSAVRLSFDWLPTLAALAEADVAGLNLEGENFSGILKGFGVGSASPSTFFWEARLRQDPDGSTAAFNWGAARLAEATRPDWKLVVEPDPEASPVPDPFCGFNTLLFDIDTDPGETTDLASQRPGIVASLLDDYLSWRGDVSRFDLSLALLRGTVTMTDADDFTFEAPGVVGLQLDERFEFIDEGSFTLKAQVRPTVLGQTQVIAEKEGTWQLRLNPSGTLTVTVTSTPAPTSVESSVPLTAGAWHELALVIHQRKNLPTYARVFVDGEWEEGRVVGDIPVTGGPTLIGASSEQLDDPFLGTVADVEFHLVGLYPEQLGGSSCP